MNVDKNKERAEVYRANKLHLIAAIGELGIESISVEFNGGGDSGQIDYVNVRGKYPEKGTALDPQKERLIIDRDTVVNMTVQSSACYNRDTGVMDVIPGGETVGTLVALIEFLAEFDLDASNVDWYNDDGGHGTWQWSVDEGFTFEINQNHVSTTTEHYTEVSTLHEWVQREEAL